MSAYDLVVLARKKQNLPSDNALAVLMGIDNQKISNWKNGKGKPNGETALYLAELAELKASEAKEIMRNGFSMVSLLIVTASASTLAMALLLTVKQCILCKIKLQLTKTQQTRVTGYQLVSNLQIA